MLDIRKLVCVFAMTLITVVQTANAEMIGLWLLEEGVGADIKDSSGKAHHGILEGKSEWTDGKYGKGILFQGGRVNVAHADDLSLETWSMSLWVKVKGPTGTYQMVMGKEGWPNRNYSMWILPTVMTFGFTTGALDIQTQVGEIADDKWHHLVGAYDGKNLMGWVDGKMLIQVGAAGKPNQCECPFFIGSQPPGGGGPTMGAIDEVSLYNHALTENEVKSALAGLKSLAVEPQEKLVTAWAALKARE